MDFVNVLRILVSVPPLKSQVAFDIAAAYKEHKFPDLDFEASNLFYSNKLDYKYSGEWYSFDTDNKDTLRPLFNIIRGYNGDIDIASFTEKLPSQMTSRECIEKLNTFFNDKLLKR